MATEKEILTHFVSPSSVEGAAEAVQELLLDDRAKTPEAEGSKSKPTEDVKMAAGSKELTPEKKESSASDSSSSLGSIIYSVAKKVITVGAIYLVGYMGWSVAWLIGA